MVPACYPRKISSTTGLREAVVFALPSVTGLVRWTDYIPVKLVASADAALEGRTDAGGFIPMDMLSSNTGLMGWVDYLPVYVDNSATDAWAITDTGFIPYAASGGGAAIPPALVYGATADAGEIDDATTITGTRYWWNFGSGSDANDPPTSPAAPAQTLAKLGDWTSTLGTKTAPAGSGFMIARGQFAVGFLIPNNFSGSYYGDYLFGATGTGSRPLIQFANSAALNNSNNMMMLGNRPNTRVRNLSFDMQKTFAATASAVTGTFVDGDVVSNGSGATGVFKYNLSDVYTIQLTSYPTMFANGNVITAAGGKQATINSLSYCTGVTLLNTGQSVVNTEIRNALGIGLLMSNSGGSYAENALIDNCLIEDCCLVQANGAGLDGGGNIAVSKFVDGVKIKNTTFKNNGNGGTSHNAYINDLSNFEFTGNWSYMTVKRGNHALVIHGACSVGLIANNLLETCNNGIGINDGYGGGGAEYYDQLTIRNNINRLHGTISGQGQGQAMELSCLTNSNVYNNLHYSCNLGYNVFAKRASGGADLSSSGNTFSHETIYNVAGGLNVSGTMGATNNVFQNLILASTAASGNILTVDANAYPKTTLRNLCIWMPNNTGNAILWNGTAYTIDDWFGVGGPNQVLGLGCINADPLFTNAAAGDFTLQAGSPCKLAGYNSGITTDFAGNARHATTPSIGAYE